MDEILILAILRLTIGVDDKNVQVFENESSDAATFALSAEYELSVSRWTLAEQHKAAR